MEIIAAHGIDLPPMARAAMLALLLLFLPFASGRLKIPEPVFCILVGVVLGPHLLGVMPRHPQVAQVIGEMGKVLLMFFVGLEIDLQQFKEHRKRALVFGILTFALPLAAGIVIGLAFHYALLSALLIGALLSSHTLIAYPTVHESGQGGRPSVTITAGSTVLADMFALLMLAFCLTTFHNGFDLAELGLRLLYMAVFVFLVLGVLGRAGKWLFANLGKTENAAFQLLLAIVMVAAVLAQAFRLETILGAFLAGLAVNEASRDTPAKQKLEFFGNRFFIPVFFVVVGLMIDLRAFAQALTENTMLVLAMIAGALGAKWLAAIAASRVWVSGPRTAC
jgi:Kef-type K+ transport system membrane component KefB